MPESPLLSAQRATQLVQSFTRQHVLVVGDMVADEYIFGTPARISREAPVVVLEYGGRRLVPGGATNVAVNARALGATVHVVGVIGDDEVGRELAAALRDLGIVTDGLIVDPDRPTSIKTRIVGGGPQVVRQQMVRIDRVDSTPLHGAVKDRLLHAVDSAVGRATALILSDYENGVMDREVIRRCLPDAAVPGQIRTVDAHGDLFRFQGITLATPNQPEAEATLGRHLADAEDLRAAGAELLEGMHAQGVLITRGSLGMAVMDRAGLFLELPARLVEVRDATGAGDTVAAVATLALGAGATLAEAAVLGNLAASLVVRRVGAATVTASELARTVGDL